MSPRAVVGLGVRDRGDDAIGLLVADRVRELCGASVTVVTASAPTELLDVFERFDDVVVVDAVRSGASPGAVAVHGCHEGPLATPSSAAGTHGLGVAEVVELARALDRLPARLVVVGVELGDVTTGAEVSEAVARAVDTAVEQALGAGRGPACA